MQLVYVVLGYIPCEGDRLIAVYDNPEAADACAKVCNTNPASSDFEYHIQKVPLQSIYTPLTQ